LFRRAVKCKFVSPLGPCVGPPSPPPPALLDAEQKGERASNPFRLLMLLLRFIEGRP